MTFWGKFSNPVGSAILVFAGFSLGLVGCGSNDSNSNPGLGGTAGASVSSVPATCPNPIDASSLTGPATSDPRFDLKTDYALSHVTIYVYNPGNGDSFFAKADARDGFQISTSPENFCNGMIGNSRHPEEITVPQMLNSRNSQDRLFSFEFAKREVESATSTLMIGGQESFGLDQLGQGSVLISQDEYVSARVFVGERGDVEIRSETQFPVDRTGNRKLLFISARYTSQGQDQDRPTPGKHPGRPER